MEAENQAPLQNEVKEPSLEEALAIWDELDSEAGMPVNSRKRVDYNYFEIAKNQIGFIPGPGYAGGPAPAFYPGEGEGIATRMGKMKSFLNQFATFENGQLVTVGAPVADVYAPKLALLGLTNIRNAVNSVTVDNKGNAIYFKNLKNTVTPVSPTLSSFVAEIQIIGGNGRFKNASGEGVVRGNFNPINGEGRSVTLAELSLK
jgi:hypothetical protein